MTAGTDRRTTARVQRLADALDEALDRIEAAPAFGKPRHQEDLYALASDLMDSDEGMAALAERAKRFDAAGVFHGGPWENPSRLVAGLVAVSLTGEGVYPTVESLSELRLVSLASGEASHPDMSAEEARDFLEEVCAKNVQLMFPGSSEVARRRPKVHARAERLFALIRDRIAVEGLRDRVVEEIELLCAQRPIQTALIRELVRGVGRLPGGSGEGEFEARMERFRAAMGDATELSREAGDPIEYRRAVRALNPDALVAEARAFASLMQETGLCSPYHAVCLREVGRVAPERIGEALGASESGVAEAARDAELAAMLVRRTVVPDTAHVMYGLAGMLERGLLSRTEIAGGLRRVSELTLRPEVAETLLHAHPGDSGLDANEVLLGGCVSVLGQPLGIGQGNNPTCQSARGISLWSLHAPGLLLGMIASAARDGYVQTDFEGNPMRSDLLPDGVAQGAIDLDLDPVSQVLVPHLDRIYSAMMAAAGFRGEDPHKWVNPALYGRWIPKGFASAFVPGTQVVSHHQAFVRRFYATHHLEYNDGHELIYPNPVGLMVTDAHGHMLGPHAVSLQRVAPDPEGGLRCYFFNPNNEGRQDWGHGVHPAVAGHGEQPGESSLPFAQFASRLYAYHYVPEEEGDAFAVPEATVSEVSDLARQAWGKSLPDFR